MISHEALEFIGYKVELRSLYSREVSLLYFSAPPTGLLSNRIVLISKVLTNFEPLLDSKQSSIE